MAIISGVWVLSLPFLGEAVEHPDEKDARATSGIQKSLVEQRVHAFQGDVQRDFSKEARCVERARPPLTLRVFCLQKVFVDRTDRLDLIIAKSYGQKESWPVVIFVPLRNCSRISRCFAAI